MSTKPETHYQKLEKLYLSANIQQMFSGSTIAVSHSRSEITLPIDPKYFHGAQAIHGATYFKVLDDAAYFAVASLITDVFIVTSSFQINLTRPVASGTLKAIGTVRSVAKNLFVAEASLLNDRGKEVAFGTGQFMRTAQPWDSLEHYTL